MEEKIREEKRKNKPRSQQVPTFRMQSEQGEPKTGQGNDNREGQQTLYVEKKNPPITTPYVETEELYLKYNLKAGDLNSRALSESFDLSYSIFPILEENSTELQCTRHCFVQLFTKKVHMDCLIIM